MYDKIINPLTGRNVYINSNLGKEIITNYVTVYQYGGSGESVESAFDGLESKVLSAVVRPRKQLPGEIWEAKEAN